MEQNRFLQLKVLTSLLVVQILFGINYVVSKVVIRSFPPLLWASIRIGCAAVFLVLLALCLKRKRPTFNLEFFKSLTLFACLGVIINQGSFLVGLKYTTASNSSILTTLIPIFTLVMVTLSGKEPLSLRRGLGFASALAGVLVLKKVEDFSSSDQTHLGDGLTILNCLSYSLFLATSRKFIQKHDPIWITAGLFTVGTIGLSLLAIPSWISFEWPPFNPQLWGCVLFSILGSTLLAYLLNLWALGHTQSSSVALAIYLQPLFGSLLAWYYLDEVVTLRMAFASFLIFLGMLISLTPKAVPPSHSTKLSP